jgi:hypothetical protein
MKEIYVYLFQYIRGDEQINRLYAGPRLDIDARERLAARVRKSANAFQINPDVSLEQIAERAEREVLSGQEGLKRLSGINYRSSFHDQIVSSKHKYQIIVSNANKAKVPDHLRKGMKKITKILTGHHRLNQLEDRIIS